MSIPNSQTSQPLALFTRTRPSPTSPHSARLSRIAHSFPSSAYYNGSNLPIPNGVTPPYPRRPRPSFIPAAPSSPSSGLSRLPQELVLYILELAVSDLDLDNPRYRQPRYNLLSWICLSCQSFLPLALLLLHQHVWLATEQAANRWGARSRSVSVNRLTVEYDAKDELSSVLAKCDNIKELRLLSGRMNSWAKKGDMAALASPALTGLTSLVLRWPLSITTSTPFPFVLTTVIIDNPWIDLAVYHHVLAACSDRVKTLTVIVNLSHGFPVNDILSSETLRNKIGGVEDLIVNFWGLSRSDFEAITPSAFSEATELRRLTYDSISYDSVYQALSHLPPTCPLEELVLSSLGLVKDVLNDSRVIEAPGLRELKVIRVAVGSFGQWSFPTIPREMVKTCERKGWQVITVDPFGEERHVAPVPASQPTPRWMLTVGRQPR